MKHHTETQETAILNDLQTGVVLTPLDALKRHGCFRLGARIYDLQKQGFNIIHEPVTVKGKRVMSYRMKP